MDKIIRVESKYRKRKIREKIEWANYWMDKDHDKLDTKNKRILLVGDSTSREIRSTLTRVAKMPVDFIGSSSHVLDELLLRQIEFFFEFNDFHYEMIHIQFGCHGIESLPEGTDLESFYNEYRQQYLEVLKFLKKHCKILVAASATQIVKYPYQMNNVFCRIYNKIHIAAMEKADPVYEADIVMRNTIVNSICSDLSIPFNDLYMFMLETGKHMRHIDHVHYEKKAKKLIANRVLSFINS